MHKLTEQGKKDLLQTAKWAAEHPDSFDMDHVFVLAGFYFTESLNNCNTSGCLAGWGAHQALSKKQRVYLNRTRLQSNRSDNEILITVAMLHLSGGWDVELSMLYNLMPNQYEGLAGITANNVVQVVEAFIKDGIEGACRYIDRDPKTCCEVMLPYVYRLNEPLAKEVLAYNG